MNGIPITQVESTDIMNHIDAILLISSSKNICDRYDFVLVRNIKYENYPTKSNIMFLQHCNSLFLYGEKKEKPASAR